MESEKRPDERIASAYKTQIVKMDYEGKIKWLKDRAIEIVEDIPATYVREEANKEVAIKDDIVFTIFHLLNDEYGRMVKEYESSMDISSKDLAKLVLDFARALDEMCEACLSEHGYWESRKVLLEKIFKFWQPESIVLEDSSEERKNACAIFDMMTSAYERASEEERKDLNLYVRQKLENLGADAASAWMAYNEDMPEAFGSLLGVCRAKSGGYPLTLEDVEREKIFGGSIKVLSYDARDEIKKRIAGIREWDGGLLSYFGIATASISEYDHRPVFEVDFSKYPEELSIKMTIFHCHMETPDVFPEDLINYIEGDFSDAAEKHFVEICKETVWRPTNVHMDVFYGSIDLKHCVQLIS